MEPPALELNALFEVLPDAIVALGPEGTIAFVNGQTEALFGYTREELLHQPVEILIPERFRNRHSAHRNDFLAHPHMRPMGAGHELYGLRKNGSEFPVEIMLNSFEGPDGILAISAIRDNPERKAREDLLRDKEEALRQLVLGVKDYAIFMLDPQGHVVTWNEGAERIKGYSADEIVGQHFSRFYLPQDVADDKPSHELEIALREGRFEEEGWRVRKDGSRFMANVILTALRDTAGKPHGFRKVTRDITDRKAAEALQLQLKDEFLSHVSHELRSPLTSIYSFCTIIADGLAGETSPKQDEYLKIILKNSLQLQSMIDDLLEITKAQTGKLSIHLQRVSVSDAIAYALDTLQTAANAKQICLSATPSAALPLIHTDLTRLRQILTILLDNAVKFTPEKGNVHVEAAVYAENPDFLLLKVCDTGCGLSPEATERIFEHLYQVSHSHSAGRRGLGLGLYIARQLVTRMGGRIWVTSQPNQGSQFCFTVPIFSLSALLRPILKKDPEFSGTLALVAVHFWSANGSLKVPRDVLNDAHLLLKEALRSDMDVLLPNRASDNEQSFIFVVGCVEKENANGFSERIRAILRGSEQIRTSGFNFAVSHRIVISPANEPSLVHEGQIAQLAQEIQKHIDTLSSEETQPT